MKPILAALVGVFIFAAHAAHSASYAIDHAQSSIGFSGTHADTKFSGSFARWSGKILFDPANLSASSILVTVDTSSAVTGNTMFDGTLPNEDWFNVKEYPQATFASETITANSDGGFTAKGTLTLKDKKVPVLFSFALSDLKNPPVRTRFTLVLDRLALGMGVASDPAAEWVSREITLDVALVAEPR